MNYNSLDELSKAIVNERGGLNNINIVVGNVDIYTLETNIRYYTNNNMYDKSILAFEDPEYKVYYKYYPKICENIINRSNDFSNTFITTQSLEFIDSLLEVANKKNILDNISVFTCIERENKKYVYRKLSGKDALRVREDYCMELRC